VGWLTALFLVVAFLTTVILGAIVLAILQNAFHVDTRAFNAGMSIVQETAQFAGLLAAAWVSALIENRRILDYNLHDSRGLRHFATGAGGGFAALSLLVAALCMGGWLHIGRPTLSAGAVAEFAVLWGIGFLFTGLGEEGLTRCYMLFTLERGINFWWALGSVACLSLLAWASRNGGNSGGVYLAAALGVAPCFYLHWKRSPSAGFWEAAWLTSTFFGYIHTLNPGETWLGVFATAAIGFVFCVSVRLTGSAWWAIGFHAAWDWAQTFFYGTPDSGLQPRGHLFSSTASGSAFWSGGNTGPEGSVLILPAVLLIVLALIAVYGRRSRTESASTADLPQLS
jgi:hypothetical protein